MISSTAFPLFLAALFLFAGVSTISAFSSVHHDRGASIQPQYSRSSKLHAAKTAIDTYLEDANYNQIMTNKNNNKAVLVDCCAKWCGPCKLIDPFLVQAAEQFATELDIVKFDVEAKNCGGIKMEFLLQEVMPQALPALIFFRNGQARSMKTGALSQKELMEFIETNLKEQHGTAADDGSDNTQEEEMSVVGSSKKGKISLGGAGKDDYML